MSTTRIVDEAEIGQTVRPGIGSTMATEIKSGSATLNTTADGSLYFLLSMLVSGTPLSTPIDY